MIKETFAFADDGTGQTESFLIFARAQAMLATFDLRIGKFHPAKVKQA
ncbi:hypothetical protein [Tranquillimonas rosea]|nr:hypothetical protein [Tranquillimonas rosea]